MIFLTERFLQKQSLDDAVSLVASANQLQTDSMDAGTAFDTKPGKSEVVEYIDK